MDGDDNNDLIGGQDNQPLDDNNDANYDEGLGGNGGYDGLNQDPGSYGINPNQQINDNFLGGGNQLQDADDGLPVNANGMFNGNRGQDNQEEENEEYFDDAGDIGYLPADHVSFKIIHISDFSCSIAFDDQAPKRPDQATDRRARENRLAAQRKRRGSTQGQKEQRRHRCSAVWRPALTRQDADQVRKNSRKLQHRAKIPCRGREATRNTLEVVRKQERRGRRPAQARA